MTRPTLREHVRSDEEYHFILWINEAVAHGLVSDWLYEPKHFTLFEKQTYKELVQMKTKSKTVDRHLHSEAHYTPDFCVSLTELGITVLFNVFKPCILTGKSNTVWLDVKGAYNPNDQPRYFSIIQKAMYSTYGIWAIKVIPFYKKNSKAKGLFAETYAPEKLRWLNGRKKPTLSSCGNCCTDIQTFINSMSQLPQQQ